MNEVRVGTPVQEQQAAIGRVIAVDDDPASGAVAVLVQGLTGELRRLAPGSYRVVDGVVVVDDAAALMPAPEIVPQPAQQLASASADEIRIPVLREEAIVRTRQVDRGGMRVVKTVAQREELVEHPFVQERADVERVAIGRYVDIAPGVREEGDVLIIPILEEVVVVEKRLLLKEEIHIRRERTEQMLRERVVLRSADARIEAIAPRQDEVPG